MRVNSGIGVLLVLTGALIVGCAREPQSFTVVSFNIRHADMDEDGDEFAWDQRRESVIETIDREDPDLLGLQEAAAEQREDLAERLGLECVGCEPEIENHNIVLYDGDTFLPVDFGVFWLSDTPDIRNSTSWGNSMPRSATWVRLKPRLGGTTTAQFAVYNTHLDHESGEARRRGLELILSHAAETAGDIPVLLMGDFNAFPNSPELDLLRSRTTERFPHLPLRDVLDVGSRDYTDEGTFHEFSGEPEIPRIDYILISEGLVLDDAEVLTTDTSNGTPPSDHFPVRASILAGRSSQPEASP